jgi:hypothetical protein
MIGRHVTIEVVVSALLAVGGIVLTSVGVLGHVGTLVAPGALLILVGGGWLGNALARRDVRLFPTRDDAGQLAGSPSPPGRGAG